MHKLKLNLRKKKYFMTKNVDFLKRINYQFFKTFFKRVLGLFEHLFSIFHIFPSVFQYLFCFSLSIVKTVLQILLQIQQK